MIRVVDRGPGLAYGEHERVFEPFYRGPTPVQATPARPRPGHRQGFVEPTAAGVWAGRCPEGHHLRGRLPVQPVATPVSAADVTAGRRVLICDDELHILRALRSSCATPASTSPPTSGGAGRGVDPAPDAAYRPHAADGHGVDIVRTLRG
jgi:hypothetical protein